MSAPFAAILALLAAFPTSGAELRRDPAGLGVPFQRYYTVDPLGREIAFYVADPPTIQRGLIPLTVFIQGSGCDSVFRKPGDRTIGGYQELLRTVATNRARVMIVEKPGVTFLDTSQQSGTAIGCSQEFLEQHTLDRWGAANAAAIRAAENLPGVNRRRILVIGHSEGGIVAARVAALLPEVTHVALLASGGPEQLFGLAEAARRQAGNREAGDAVFEAWKAIEGDPQSTTRFFAGHPYRRWSSFLGSSPIRELLRSTAEAFVAQGSRDPLVAPEELDLLQAELAAQHRPVLVRLVEGANHTFDREGETPPAGMRAILAEVLMWFLK